MSCRASATIVNRSSVIFPLAEVLKARRHHDEGERRFGYDADATPRTPLLEGQRETAGAATAGSMTIPGIFSLSKARRSLSATCSSNGFP